MQGLTARLSDKDRHSLANMSFRDFVCLDAGAALARELIARLLEQVRGAVLLSLKLNLPAPTLALNKPE